MAKTVCAVIVTYNRVEILKNALASIREQAFQPSAIIVVDNNSSDGTMDYANSLTGSGNIKCIHLDANIGYAGGIAYGMDYALSIGTFDYFWIMDDDTYHEKNTLADLVNAIEQSDFGILGLNGMNIRLGTKKAAVSNEKMMQVDYVLIDGALVKADVVRKIGTPHEKFFMMCEDWEYCLRIRKNGFKVGSLNNIPIRRLYLGGQGGGYSKSTLWRGYYQARNHIIIMKEYFSFGHLYGYSVRQLRMIATALLYAPDRFTRVKFRLLGIWHGLRGIEGKTLDPGTLKFNYKKEKARILSVVNGN